MAMPNGKCVAHQNAPAWPTRGHDVLDGDPDQEPVPRCGALTRADTFCKLPPMPNGRCRMHGGASTGPTTAKGRQRSLKALRDGHAAWLARKNDPATHVSPEPDSEDPALDVIWRAIQTEYGAGLNPAQLSQKYGQPPADIKARAKAFRWKREDLTRGVPRW